MDRWEVEGEPVLMQLAQPCDSSGRRAEFLLTHVRGEYEDEDGDWAMGFILADAWPSAKPKPLNGSQIHSDSSGAQLSQIRVLGDISRDRSTETLAANPISTDTLMAYDDASESSFACRCTKTALKCEKGADACYALSRDPNCSKSGTDMELKSSSRMSDYISCDQDESMPCGESSNRKPQLDTANLAYMSHESEDGIFCCESCGQTLPLNSVYPMLNCDCLLCISCCRLHVESSLSAAIRRTGNREELGLDKDYQRTRDNGANSAADATKRSDNGDHVEDTYMMEANPTRFSQGETITACEEGGLDLYVELCLEESEACLDSIPCPTPSCRGCFQLSGVLILAPKAFREWEEAASQDLMEQCTSYVNCPGCGIVIEKVVSELPPGIALSGVPEFDRTVPFIELDYEGNQLSRSALCHRAEHRFRCSVCSVEFCGECMNVPYHLGKTCEEFQVEKNSVKCFYCEVPIRSRRQDETTLVPCSVRELRKQLDKDDVDALWCMEKKELIAVQKFASSVCASKECRKLLHGACTRTLDCGHHCGGVRGERLCLPCLEDDCRLKGAFYSGNRHLPSADDLCSICLVEPLRQAPSIQLKCGHVVHMHCARTKLEEGCPGPAISFGYLNCPQCPEVMQHSSLNRNKQKPLALFEQVKEKALTRLKMEGLLKSAKELKAGGRFEGKPTDFALQLYRYYICCKCNAPYFGGQRDCAANDAEQNGNLFNPLNLVCGGCSSASSGQGLCQKGHGKEFVEFKCKFCCSVATYFCFGQTHFCESCHTTRPDGRSNFIPVQCRGPQWCPLRTSHRPNGQECCLGCSMCRLYGQ